MHIFESSGTSLAVQWLGHVACTDVGLGLIPDQGTKTPQAVPHSQKKKKSALIVFSEKPSAWAVLQGTGTAF